MFESITQSWKNVSDSMWKAFNKNLYQCAFPRNFEDVSSKLYFCLLFVSVYNLFAAKFMLQFTLKFVICNHHFKLNNASNDESQRIYVILSQTKKFEKIGSTVIENYEENKTFNIIFVRFIINVKCLFTPIIYEQIPNSFIVHNPRLRVN